MPLSNKQIQSIGECLRAAAYGPFFPDGEFDTLFGLSREQVAPMVGLENWVTLNLEFETRQRQKVCSNSSCACGTRFLCLRRPTLDTPTFIELLSSP